MKVASCRPVDAPCEGEMANESIRTALSGGDRRSIGNADGVAATIADDPRLLEACVRAMSDDDPVVRMRAADAVEKASRSRPALLAAHQAALLGSIADIDQHEVRWHLLQLMPRLARTADAQRAWFERALPWVRSDRRIVAAEAFVRAVRARTRRLIVARASGDHCGSIARWAVTCSARAGPKAAQECGVSTIRPSPALNVRSRPRAA
jgi:hypothetical protein